jgi:dienelactone hydrolase
MIGEERFIYRSDDLTMRGAVAWDRGARERRPAVLVAHTWAGIGSAEIEKAERLAALGYVGIAIDLFGEGKTGGSAEEKAALIRPLLDDRRLLRSRMAAAVEAARDDARVDASRVAAIGFCFGGLAALELARGAAEVSCVVSFHGLLPPPGDADGSAIRAPVLVLHGHRDPLAPPEHVARLAGELDAAGVDWQIHLYGGAMHAFTNPLADAPEDGIAYDAAADRRSWRAMTEFLAESFRAPVG